MAKKQKNKSLFQIVADDPTLNVSSHYLTAFAEKHIIVVAVNIFLKLSAPSETIKEDRKGMNRIENKTFSCVL